MDTAAIIEWVFASGYRQNVGGSWVDHRGDTVARTTEDLVNICLLSQPVEAPAKATRRKGGAEYRRTDDKGSMGRGRRPGPNRRDMYGKVVARKDTACQCCQGAIQRGRDKWQYARYDVCDRCYQLWPKGVELRLHPNYIPDVPDPSTPRKEKKEKYTI